MVYFKDILDGKQLTDPIDQLDPLDALNSKVLTLCRQKWKEYFLELWNFMDPKDFHFHTKN